MDKSLRVGEASHQKKLKLKKYITLSCKTISLAADKGCNS